MSITTSPGNLLLAVALFSADGDPLPPGETIEKIETRADPGQSYALYLPGGYDSNRPFPILYCFDPRKRGSHCVELFRNAADRLGWIVAASNNARSDGPIEPNLVALKAIWIDTHERLAIDDRRTYATGFSGGARIANLMAQILGFTGVVAVGAGFPPSAPPRAEIPFDFYALVGEEDFNYYEVLGLGPTLDEMKIEHRIERFDGGHTWCPAERCGAALDWMELRAMSRGLIPADADWIRRQLTERLVRAETMERSQRPDRALTAYRAIERDFAGTGETARAALAVRRLEQDAELPRRLRLRARWDRRAREYLDRLPEVLARITSADQVLPGHKTLVSELELSRWTEWAAGPVADERTLAARRLMGMVYVQTAQTQVGPLIAAGRYSRAATALAVAAEIRPENPIVWYNLGCARARAGWREAALEAIERAIDAGFVDGRLMERDPDLESLRDDPRFAESLDRLAALSE